MDIRIERGAPTPDEIGALVTVVALLRTAGRAAQPPPVKAPWLRPDDPPTSWASRVDVPW